MQTELLPNYLQNLHNVNNIKSYLQGLSSIAQGSSTINLWGDDFLHKMVLQVVVNPCECLASHN